MKEQVDLLVNNTSRVLQVVCAEFQTVYESRLTSCQEKIIFAGLLRKSIEEALWRNSTAKGIHFMFVIFVLLYCATLGI